MYAKVNVWFRHSIYIPIITSTRLYAMSYTQLLGWWPEATWRWLANRTHRSHMQYSQSLLSTPFENPTSKITLSAPECQLYNKGGKRCMSPHKICAGMHVKCHVTTVFFPLRLSTSTKTCPGMPYLQWSPPAGDSQDTSHVEHFCSPSTQKNVYRELHNNARFERH